MCVRGYVCVMDDDLRKQRAGPTEGAPAHSSTSHCHCQEIVPPPVVQPLLPPAPAPAPPPLPLLRWSFVAVMSVTRSCFPSLKQVAGPSPAAPWHRATTRSPISIDEEGGRSTPCCCCCCEGKGMTVRAFLAHTTGPVTVANPCPRPSPSPRAWCSDIIG